MSELAAVFLRLGTTSFGGPAAHIAMMRDEVVRRRGWMRDDEFVDLLSAANLIPGPNSTELAIHIGWRRGRALGLVVAGVSFILPAALITLAIAWGYVRFGQLPQVDALLYGIKPVVLAIVAQAVLHLVSTALRSSVQRALGAASVLACVLGAHELAVLFGAGLVALCFSNARRASAIFMPLPLVAVTASATPSSIFWTFAKIGSVLFGSGYVLLAFLRAELVERLHWMSEAQLVDAIAVGQMTPGPVFTSATFVGYLLDGTRGAIAATLGIFLPAFVFVAASLPLIARLRASRGARAFLDGVNAASWALMAVVTAELGRAALVDVATTLLAVAALVVSLRWKTNTAWLVLAGAAVGWIARALARTI